MNLSEMERTEKPSRLVSRMVLLYSLVHALINVAWLAKRGGKGAALHAAVLGVGLPAAAEVWITSLDKLLTHRTSLQVLGVPLAIPLLWFNIIFGSLATVETALKRSGFSEEEVETFSAPAAALTATSLDLVMDCFGLDSGLWEWKLGGPYAKDVIGANGERGIPILNFLGWLTLAWSVVYLFQKADRERANRGERTRKVVILALIPYYLVSVAWSVKCGKLRFLFYSAAFPVLVAYALSSRH